MIAIAGAILLAWLVLCVVLLALGLGTYAGVLWWRSRAPRRPMAAETRRIVWICTAGLVALVALPFLWEGRQQSRAQHRQDSRTRDRIVQLIDPKTGQVFDVEESEAEVAAQNNRLVPATPEQVADYDARKGSRR